MKHESTCAFSKPRLLIALSFVLPTVFFALVGSGAMSKGSDEIKRSAGSLKAAPASANAHTHSKDVGLRDSPDRYLDGKGNRASGIKRGNNPGVKHRGERPVGSGAWT